MARDLAARPNREIAIRLGPQPQPQLPRVLGLGCSGYRDRTRSQVTLLMRASTQASTQNRRIVFARSSPFRGAGQLQLQENEQLPVIGCASQFDMF